MIRKVYSSLPTFKTVHFHEGLNIIVAEKTEESILTDTKIGTRNGAGKTTLLEIINFILAANSDSIFKSESLKNHTFFLDLFIDNKEYTISRLQNNITIIEYDLKGNVATSETDHFKKMYDRLATILFPDKPDCISFREAIADVSI